MEYNDAIIWFTGILCATVIISGVIVASYYQYYESKDNHYQNCLWACDNLDQYHNPSEYVECVGSCNRDNATNSWSVCYPEECEQAKNNPEHCDAYYAILCGVEL